MEPAPPYDLDRSGLLLSHIAISVADIERSLKFYRALGFEVSGSRPIRPEVARTMGVTGPFAARLAFIRRDGIVIELVEMETPRVSAPAAQGIAAQLGLAHMAIQVDDVGRVAALVEAHGGSLLTQTRLAGDGRDMMFCTDPDGTRIEIVWIDPAIRAQLKAPAHGMRT